MKYRLPILLLWLAAMAWLVRYEAFPEKFERVIAGYSRVLSRDMLVLDSWMRIRFKDAPIGYSHTRVDVNEDSADAHYVVENRLHLRLTLMGRSQDVHVETDVFLDPAQRLQRFVFTLSARDYGTRISGRRLRGTLYEVETKTGSATSRMEVEIPDDVVIYSPMTEMALRNLKPGETLRIRVLDPASLASSTMSVTAEAREPLALAGGTVPATRLSMDYQGMRVESWIDEAGNILRQTTPFGWILESCTPDQAFEAVRGPGAGSDMLSELAVRVQGAIPEPRAARELRLRLTGVRFAPGELDTARQRAEAGADGSTVLTIRADAFAAGTGRLEDASADLAATAWVQSDHPDIRRQAARLVEGLTNDLDKAGAIGRWVHREVKKEMKVSLPSAVDVLRTMKGDCNEHTYLFVALARAAGLPARIHVGLAYQEGAFYYHAWPGVYVGRWLEMDPTWGQLAADATHLSVVQGELASQIQLARVVGQLRIEVLASSAPAAAAPGESP